MDKHTPGPWEFIGTGIRDQRGLSLASVSYANGSVSMKIKNWETIANARLIAAAPEMLALIQDNVEAFEQEFQGEPRLMFLLNKARVLLARIKGKG